MKCYDPVGCWSLWENCGDWEEDRACWDAHIDCWESTHPCVDHCPPWPRPDEICETCWKEGDKDFDDPCGYACEDYYDETENYPYDDCNDCWMNSC